MLKAMEDNNKILNDRLKQGRSDNAELIEKYEETQLLIQEKEKEIEQVNKELKQQEKERKKQMK